MLDSTVRILKQARRKIENPDNWVRGHYAIDKDGLSVDWYDRSAVGFCALGAVKIAAYKVDPDIKAENVLRRACYELFNAPLVLINDDPYFGPKGTRKTRRTKKKMHADVLRVYDRAIEMAE